jgi:hypothetical protein
MMRSLTLQVPWYQAVQKSFLVTFIVRLCLYRRNPDWRSVDLSAGLISAVSAEVFI